MKKRFNRWVTHYMHRYIPGNNLLAADEAKRLAHYIADKFTEQQQLVILDAIKANLIEHRTNQITTTQSEIVSSIKNLDQLKLNLEKLTVK